MKKTIGLVIGLVLVGVLGLSSCIAHRQYRTNYELCEGIHPEPRCEESALHRHPAEEAGGDYFLGFVELDDQGQLWDRAQLRAVLDHLAVEVATNDLLLVVFVHGWKHSAAPGDSNIEMFRRNLAVLGQVQARICAETGATERKVAGVYVGWRGGSVSLPVLKELTFWDRKNTAHGVGRGGVTEVFAGLEQIRGIRGSVSRDPNHTRLVVVGHSFGGAVVYSALAEILEERFVNTTGGPAAVGAARGFGDLVVLINPAFEALQLGPLSDMSTERGSYFPDQLPVLAILTSEGDDATGRAFPIGRFFSTLFEREREVQRENGHTREIETIDQGAANLRAVGHFEPYRTHELVPAEAPPDEDVAAYLVDEFYDLSAAWERDTSGGSIAFPGSVLHRRETTAERNPYLVIRVSEEIIPDHNQIDDPRVVMFLQQLILLSAQDDDPKVRAELRARAREK